MIIFQKNWAFKFRVKQKSRTWKPDNAGHLFTVTHPNSNPARQDLTSVIGRDLVPREIAEEDHHSRGPVTRKAIWLPQFDVYLSEF